VVRTLPLGELDDANARAIPGTAFDVGRDGTLWVGRGDGLVRLEPSGVVRRFTVPINARSVFTGITAVVVGEDGEVAVGLSASNNLLVFDPAVGSFTGHALPGAAGVNRVVALSSERWAVGRGNPRLGTGEIDVVGPGGQDRALPVAGTLMAGAASTIVVAVTDAELRSVDVGTAASSDDVTALPGLGDDALILPPAVIDRAGTVLVGLKSGMATLTSKGWSPTQPDPPCPPVLGTAGQLNGPTTAPNPHPVCPPTARGVALDGAGHRWLLTTSGSVYIASGWRSSPASRPVDGDPRPRSAAGQPEESCRRIDSGLIPHARRHKQTIPGTGDEPAVPIGRLVGVLANDRAVPSGYEPRRRLITMWR
jgi:hypothetical protein